MPTIETLLRIPKRTMGKAKPKAKANQAHLEWRFPLDADHDGIFEAIFRRLVDLPEAFSFGLIYMRSGATTVQLVRVNGDHGSAHDYEDGTVINCEPHAHFPKPAQLSQTVPGEYLKPKGVARLTAEHLSPIVAWEEFKRRANVISDEAVDTIIRELRLVEQIELDFASDTNGRTEDADR